MSKPPGACGFRAGCGRWLSLSKPPGDCGFRSRVREVAEPVEATGGSAGSGPFDGLRDPGVELSKPPGTAGSGPGEVGDLSKPPVGLRVPVPSTGSGTWVGDCGFRSLRQAQGPGSGTAGSGPFDRLRDLGRRLRVPVPSTGSGTWVGDCGFRSLRRAQGPGWGPGGAGSRRPPQEILAPSNLSGIVWRAAVPPAEATPTEEDSMDQIDAPVAPAAASSVAARPGRRS